jgi:hypothetical protein
MKNRKLILLVAAILFFTSTLSAQESTAKNYRSQYTQLREKVIDLMKRAQDMSVDRLTLLHEDGEMLNLTHDLEGQVMDDFLASYERRGPDKSLLIVAHACDALAFTVRTLSSFIQTSDRRFLVLAKHGIDLMDSVEQFY